MPTIPFYAVSSLIREEYAVVLMQQGSASLVMYTLFVLLCCPEVELAKKQLLMCRVMFYAGFSSEPELWRKGGLLSVPSVYIRLYPAA
jgi:hypothetical protein